MAEITVKGIDGEVHTDPLIRSLYATDASLYQIQPDVVVIPKNEADVRLALLEAKKQNLAILARGSGTSLAGQTVNKGLVLDFTKYFNNIIEVNTSEGWARVQPGVTRDQLNRIVSGNGLHFAPDPATSSRASFGGMIANNSSGTKSVLYGKTSDHVLSLRIMLTNGEILELASLSQDEYELKCKGDTTEAAIYQGVRKVVFDNAEAIKKSYPKVMRRVGGYALDAFIENEQWNLSSLILGSEGTLAVILEAKVKLTPLPKFQNMVIVHYNDRLQSIASVKEMIPLGPAAVEMLDFHVLRNSKSNAITKKYYEALIEGDPEAVMTVEFYGDSQDEIAHKAQQLCAYLQTVPSAYAFPVTHDIKKINDALSLRKDGLGLIMGKPGIRKPLPFIEDAAIPLENLAAYIEELEKLCLDHGSEIVLYAHASVGVLHVRPTIDLTDQRDIDKMKEISDRCFDLVVKYGGAFSGEHGDGRNRSPKLKEFYGDVIYQAFKEIKKLFDPTSLLNPGIIVDAEDMRKNLRYHHGYKDQKYPFVYKYREGGDFADIVHNCSGVGACRNMEGGTMCPSFRATGEEKDSTRGRANALRLAMSGQLHFHDLTDDDVIKTLDLCLSCKACKNECPSNVDMSKLKSEVLQLRYDQKGIPLHARLVRYSPALSRYLSGWPAPIVNGLLATPVMKWMNEKLLGIDSKRNLPAYAKKKLSGSIVNTNSGNKPRVVLFADTYIQCHDTTLGAHAVRLLEQCGFEVILSDAGCCQRPLISNGFLREAKKGLGQLAAKLLPYIDAGYPILTVEPSCHTALTDDLADLLDDKVLALRIKLSIQPIEQFLVAAWKSGQLKGKFKASAEDILLHGHCHQKASYGTSSALELLTLAGAKVKEAATGCCGMAGAFGYEAHHFDLSKKIFDQKLGPALKAAGQSMAVANGFSCRHQIKDFADRQAVHVISAIEFLPE